MRADIRWALAVLLFAVCRGALAVPVTYEFSTSTTAFGVDLTLNAALGGFAVTGTFDYDSDAPLVASAPNGTQLFGAVSNFEGSVAGNAVSDPTGVIAVNNDGFVPFVPPGFPTPDPVDFLQIALNGPVPPFDFSGFGLLGYTLVNVRMFWIESYAPPDVPDFLSSSDLPAQLPTVLGRLALDFVVDGEELNFQHTVFYDGLAVSPRPVPEPTTLSLLGLGLVGFAAARRRAARAT